MRIHWRVALVTTLAATLSIGITSTLGAADTIDELVVYGSRSAFAVELDLAPLRIDLRQHRLEVGDSVRSALAASPRRPGAAEVALAAPPSRG